MPRRSSVSLYTPAARRRNSRGALICRADAPPEVREAFAEIVSSVAGDHFVPADLPLVEAYASAIAQQRRADTELAAGGYLVGGKASPWVIVAEKASRAIVALSARLRLSPQSRFDRLKAGTSSRQSAPAIDFSRFERDA